MAKARKATATDADLCMKLYELRREAEMRKARDFVNFQFQPKSIDDILKLMQTMGTKENAWARQVFSPPQQNLWVDSGSGSRPNV
jgi:hypothetical protein